MIFIHKSFYSPTPSSNLAEVKVTVKLEPSGRNTLLSRSTLAMAEETPFAKLTDPEPGR